MCKRCNDGDTYVKPFIIIFLVESFSGGKEITLKKTEPIAQRPDRNGMQFMQISIVLLLLHITYHMVFRVSSVVGRYRNADQ